MSHTDLLDEPTRSARGQKLYDLWQEAGGTLCMTTVDHRPFGRLHPYEQERWIYLAKMVGEVKHQHVLPSPADLVNHPGATQVTERIDMWNWDEATHPSPEDSPAPVQLSRVSAKNLAEDLFYKMWVEVRLAHTRRHWWQFGKPKVLDTTRETFHQYLQEQKDKATADL
jgi:hypothetical protein